MYVADIIVYVFLVGGHRARVFGIGRHCVGGEFELCQLG